MNDAPFHGFRSTFKVEKYYPIYSIPTARAFGHIPSSTFSSHSSRLSPPSCRKYNRRFCIPRREKHINFFRTKFSIMRDNSSHKYCIPYTAYSVFSALLRIKSLVSESRPRRFPFLIHRRRQYESRVCMGEDRKRFIIILFLLMVHHAHSLRWFLSDHCPHCIRPRN